MRVPKNIDPRFLQDGSGKPSLMRLIAYHGANTGKLIIYAGIALLAAEVFYLQRGTSHGIALIGIGSGLFGVGEVSKGVQSRGENSHK